MRTPHDQLAKQLLQAVLQPGGAVRIEHEVSGEVQKIDVWFEPDPERRSLLQDAGLLGRLASEPSLFEAFSDPPDLNELRDCLDKLYTWHRHMRSEARQRQAPAPPLPRLWVLSAGLPRTVLEQMGLEPDPAGPSGLYRSDPGYGLGLVVLSKLPRTADTLILRLLGRGPTQKSALTDLFDLAPDASQRPLAVQILNRLRFDMKHEKRDLTPEEQEFLMNTQPLFEQYEQELLLKGLMKGLEEGREKGRQEGLTLGIRSLQAALRASYEARFGQVPQAVLLRIEATHDLATLQAWIPRVASAADAAAAEQLLLQSPQPA
jgi:hypothetical protein